MNDLVWFYPQGHAGHAMSGHPESPQRIEAIRQALTEIGWWDKYPKIEPVKISDQVLHRVHSPAYLNLLEMTSRRGGYLDADTYVTSHSWHLAHLAAGGTLAVAKAVWDGQVKRGFALARPPGHHARHGQGMGFCLLNNIALAADALVQLSGARRLAIVDLDLHHGNGTQEIFWDRSDVFYLSTHQSPLFPGTGRMDEVGQGDGAGCSANFPLPPGSGDQAFATVLEMLILPLLDRYRPEMLLVSYGFDPHWSDPLGHLLLSAQGFHNLYSGLVTWADEHCQGKITVVLEGGYNLDAAKACTLSVTSALLGEDYSDPLGEAPYQETQTWQAMLERARSIWEL